MAKYSFGSTGPTFEGTSMIPAFASVTTAATSAAGSCGVQFVFKDAAGNTVTEPVSGFCYLTEDAAGLTPVLADTSIAKLTNGALTNVVTKGLSHFVTTAAGLLGLTITAVADDYYVVFIAPDGSLIISDVCTSSGS